MKYRFLASIPKFLLKRPFYKIYEFRLAAKVKDWKVPHHIGIILDGNRRFARDLGLENVVDGHAMGADKLDEVLNWCYEFGITVVSVWIFSLDNFQRDPEEVEGLLSLIEQQTLAYTKEGSSVHRNEVKVKYIGKTELLPDSLQQAIAEMEKSSAAYEKNLLNVAIAYGGREEITDACRLFLSDQIKLGIPIEKILEELAPEKIDSYLYTSGIPDPDLIIRTSGEVRLSGFLLWQSAYSEYYFCDTYWPEFRKIDFLRALRAYSYRKRRYGL